MDQNQKRKEANRNHGHTLTGRQDQELSHETSYLTKIY